MVTQIFKTNDKKKHFIDLIAPQKTTYTITKIKDNKNTDSTKVTSMRIQIDKTFNRKEVIRPYIYLSVIQ